MLFECKGFVWLRRTRIRGGRCSTHLRCFMARGKIIIGLVEKKKVFLPHILSLTPFELSKKIENELINWVDNVAYIVHLYINDL